jgi:asparagine synthase (glutamine-hydrolysing)
MQRGGRTVAETRVAPEQEWALGRVHLAVLHPEPQLTVDDEPVQVLFHGDLFNGVELASVALTASDASAAAVVRALYQRCGVTFATRMKGSFSVAIFDAANKRTVLATDRLGSYPLYWSQSPAGFAFASEVRAVVPFQQKRSLNPHAVNDLFQFGFPTGDRTLATGIQLMPAGSTLTYDWGTARLTLNRYASWADAFSRATTSKAQFLDAVTERFDVSMRRAIDGSHRYGLSLSGGLDTRVLLSALDRQHVRLRTFTLGGKGCADEVIGYQLAELAHTQHQFVPLEESYLADLRAMAERMVSLTDGMYTSHGFTEVLALRSFEHSDFTVLLRGHLGELAKASTAWPFHTDAAIFRMHSKSEVIPCLLARLEQLNHGSAAEGLFTPAWSDACNPAGAREALEAICTDANLAPADLCAYIYLTEYHRRVTVPSLEIFRNVVEVRLPLADEDFVTTVLEGDATWRDGVEIHQTLVRRTNPKFLKIRNPNTGAPAGAGPLQEAILDKVNSVFRRLNVYGYRHYHAFDGWMRSTFLQMADQVLLDSNTLARGIVHEQPLRTLISTAKAGETRADHVLQVLVLVELWQRETF